MRSERQGTVPLHPCKFEVRVTRDEWAALRAAARTERTSVANYIRRCINAALLDSGEDVTLLRDVEKGSPRYTAADRARAVTFRVSGMTYQAIAQRLGCGMTSVYFWVNGRGAS
jgi:hypothetical protein